MNDLREKIIAAIERNQCNASRADAVLAVLRKQEPVGVVDESDDGLFANFTTPNGTAVRLGDKLYLAPVPPADHSALDSLLDKVRADEREKCAVVCDKKFVQRLAAGFIREASAARSLGEEIRAMGGDQ